MLLTDAGQMATVLVALAVNEGRPSQISVGKETSVPPPAMELIAPEGRAERDGRVRKIEGSHETGRRLQLACTYYSVH